MQKIISTLFIILIFNIGIPAQVKYKIYKKRKYSRKDSLRGFLSKQRSCFDVHYYKLSVKVFPKKHFIEGSNKICFQVKSNTQKIQIDLFKNMEVSKILHKNKEVSYVREHNAIFINFPKELKKDSLESITVFYAGKPKTSLGTYHDHGFHWDRDEKYRHWIGISCEHTGASLWWPNKDHLSDEPDSMRIQLTVPSELKCISNGKLEKTIPEKEFTTYYWLINNPINNYNVSFYLGHYVEKTIEYKNTSGTHIIYVYALDYDEKHMDNYFRFVDAFFRFFESYFGEYPFWEDKVAILQSSYRGMEHQGCLAIGSDISTYFNWAYPIDVPWHSTLIHEIAHEWWGNSVSVSDMADAWIHEGFATYCELLFIEKVYGYQAYLNTLDKLKSFIKYSYPVVGNPDVNDNSFVNGDIYYRGALILHKLREKIGKKVFLGILLGFQLKYKKKTVNTEDFIDFVNTDTGGKYDTFLRDLLYKKR